MRDMFSFSFTLILFIIVGVSSNSNALPSNTLGKAVLFGQFHQLIDNQNQDQTPQISCYRVRANIKNAHPTDNTKYVICRDSERYEILTCPNGGIFDNNEKACIDLCEQKKPCLNQGQCIILSNLTLQCVCRRDWTGEQCEIPLSTCASNPCGPNAECRMLKTNDYSQDYVCLCNKHRSYGRNCQQTVPNPCLMNIQQFHPFAYSRQAYINCDDELIFFQPCNGKLYWNQEDKRCDRMLPALLRAPFANLHSQWKKQQENQQQQQQNVPTLSQGLGAIGTNQRLPSQSQSWSGSQTNQNQGSTSTGTQQRFPLQGFAGQNLKQQNNGNNPIQSIDQSQPWSGSQTSQTQDSTSVNTQQRFPLQGFSGLNLKQQNNGNSPTQSIGQSQSWSGSQTNQNQGATSTGTQQRLSLQGFAGPNLKQQNNGNNPTQPIAQSQSWQSQNQQLTPKDTNSQVQQPSQQTNQFGLNQLHTWQTLNDPSVESNSQLVPSSFETTTVTNNGLQQGLSKFSLNGWQANPKGFLNKK